MVDFMLWLLGIVWRGAAIAAILIVIKKIIKHGGGFLNDLLDTLGIMAKAAGHWIRIHCIGYLRKEERHIDKGKGDGKVHVEATVE